MIAQEPATVAIRGLCLFGRHGVLPEEGRLGQRFITDIEIEADVSEAIAHDDYERAVCYGTLCDIASETVTGPPLALIETVAARIAEAILARLERVEVARVTIRKPSAPLAYALEDARATVTRRRAHEVGFSLGSNLGEREAVLAAAVNRLARADGVEIGAVSALYDSAPWGAADQPGFVNLCATGQTTLSPHALLGLCKETEAVLGRVPGPRWGPRALDVDLLYYGDRALADPVLELPHPRLFERAFVLEPLAEIASDRVIGGRRVADALGVLARTGGDVSRR